MQGHKELRIADISNENNNFNFGYQLTNSQLFIKNFFNPNTLYKRILINWQTGVGKSIAAISIGNEFIANFRKTFEKQSKMVCILGFTTRETIQADLFKYPELGYITEEELKELNNLIKNNDSKQVQFIANLTKRLTDKSTGGYYKFFGYREFFNQLFVLTSLGIINDINTESIADINEYINLGYIKVNEEILNSLKNSLIICDEIHNVYNSLEPNNYGTAIQYVLDILKEEAPRAVFMSATPFTGNASEVIDLLNLLDSSIKLKRLDYFYKDDDDIYQMYENTLLDIERYSRNKVSFLLDTNIHLYPKRIIIGDVIK
jgi:hypothetical protein